MRSFFLGLLVLVFWGGALAQEASLNEVLEKYYKASGYDLLQKVNTIIVSGTITQNDVMPVRITRMRPDKFFMEFDVADMTAYQGYDGTTGWMTAPWTGNAKPQPMSGDRLTDIKNRADFDGLLFNWQVKGHKAELEGTDTVNGSPAYRIKLTRADGGVEFYFIDCSSYLQVKRRFTRVIRGQEVIMEGYALDFRKVEGIPFAFTQENHMGGQRYNTLQLETVELNKPVEEKNFTMPKL